MNTVRKLIFSAGFTKQRATPVSGVTPAQSRVRQSLGGLNSAYRALDWVRKGGWQLTANELNRRQGRVGRQRLTPANTFVTLNSARRACGLIPCSDPPASLLAPPMLPSVAVVTTNISGIFTLQLVSAPYADAVQILASAPTAAGKMTFPDNTFKVIGCLSSLTGDDDIGALYSAAFGAPEHGAQIALKLVATSEAGVRGLPVRLTGVVAVVAAQSKSSPEIGLGTSLPAALGSLLKERSRALSVAVDVRERLKETGSDIHTSSCPATANVPDPSLRREPVSAVNKEGGPFLSRQSHES